MADTKDVKMKDFEDHSYFYKPYWFVVALGFILWAAYVCYRDICPVWRAVGSHF